MTNEKRFCTDMDNVLDFPSAFKFIDSKTKNNFLGNEDEIPNTFKMMP